MLWAYASRAYIRPPFGGQVLRLQERNHFSPRTPSNAQMSSILQLIAN